MLGQYFVIEVTHGVQLATAHQAVLGQHVAGLAHLLEDLLQEHRLELFGDDFQLLAPRRGRAVGTLAQAVEVLREGNDAHGSDHDQFGVQRTGALQ
ncbi:hypothetical protein D3C77_616540 [compost metagenome]